MRNVTKDERQQRVYSDVLGVFRFAKRVGWYAIKGSSVHRILYLSSVLAEFRADPTEPANLFAGYSFTVDKGGPYDQQIETALTRLWKDDFLTYASDTDCYSQGSNTVSTMLHQPVDSVRREEWIRIVVEILNAYTEERIWDFVFRDPEYRRVVESNTQTGLNTEEGNETEQTLKQFKEEFELAVGTQAKGISNTQYVEMYFEYVFGTILRREDYGL